MRYAFVAEHLVQFGVRAMCRCLRTQPSGFYAWQNAPLSQRSREDARQDVFNYIEMFHNPKRKHVRYGMLSPVEFERQQATRQEGV